MHAQTNTRGTQIRTTLSERFVEVPPHPLVVGVVRGTKMCVRGVVAVLQAVGALILFLLLIGMYVAIPLGLIYGAIWLLAIVVKAIWRALF